MKSVLCSLLFMVVTLSLIAQEQSFTYRFSTSPFTSDPAGGPELEVVGVTTTPVNVVIPATTCPDTPTVELTHFDLGGGFKAKAFFTGTYSIEIIFRFDNLGGYQRIIDFSNSLSDNGIYTHNTCLNFYPSGNIGTCPDAFDLTNYKQLVITRDGSTKEMNIYFNGSLFTTYNDSVEHYTIQSAPNDTIKFFLDDKVVPNEMGPGNLVLIRMANFVFSSTEVTTSFNNFCTRITGIAQPTEIVAPTIFPNPVSDILHIRKRDNGDLGEVHVFNSLGRKIETIAPYNGQAIDVSQWTDGIYFLSLMSAGHYAVRKILVQHK